MFWLVFGAVIGGAVAGAAVVLWMRREPVSTRADLDRLAAAARQRR